MKKEQTKIYFDLDEYIVWLDEKGYTFLFNPTSKITNAIELAKKNSGIIPELEKTIKEFLDESLGGKNAI